MTREPCGARFVVRYDDFTALVGGRRAHYGERSASWGRMVGIDRCSKTIAGSSAITRRAAVAGSSPRDLSPGSIAHVPASGGRRLVVSGDGLDVVAMGRSRAYALAAFGSHDRQASRALELVNMTQLATAHCESLRRSTAASSSRAAIAQEPKLLLLDEPTTASTRRRRKRCAKSCASSSRVDCRC